MRNFEELLAILDIKTAEKRKYVLSWLIPHFVDTISDILDRQSVQVRHRDDLHWLLDDLHWLLTEPAWMEAHVAEDGHYGDFLNEVQMAWQVAEKAGQQLEQARSEMIARQVRYALLQTSINSLASYMPPEVLIVGLRAGLWSGKAALAYAQQMTHGMTKATVLAQVGAFLREQNEEKLVHEAFASALTGLREIDNAEAHVKALVAVAPHLPLDLLSDALAATQEIYDKGDRAKCYAPWHRTCPPI